MPTKQDLDGPINVTLAAIQSVAETLPEASSSGAARDNAEAIERLAVAVRELVGARGKLNSG